MTSTSMLSSSTPSLATLPSDLLFEIASWFNLRSDVLHLSQTSKPIFAGVVPRLYSVTVLVGVEQCTQTLGMLFRQPDIARHVRMLTVRTGAYGSTVSAIIRKVALRFDALISFEWDGDEMPEEDIWFALRMLCPKLRRISTTIGSELPKQNSHLFDFVDLLGFSVTLKPGFCNGNVELFHDAQSPTCHRLWDMLENKSPCLEELSIDGNLPQPINAFHIANARWKNLRKINIGDLRIDSQADIADPSKKAPFVAFLEAHPKLQSIKFSRHSTHPSHFSHLGPETLPCVTQFSGTLEQLQQLPHIHHRLKSVTFQDPIRSRSVTTSTMAAVLQNLPVLIDLRVSFALHSMYDSSSFLRSLIAACPQLESLELTCSNVPSFQLDTFSKTIRKFTKLRRLTLALVRFPGDEALSSGAIRIARANPRLRTFSLVYLPPLQPLQFSLSLPSSFLAPSSMTGRYKVVCDEHGLPVSLVAREKRRVVWPWGLGVWQSSKSNTVDLRPVGYPGRKQRGFLGLLFEKSTSGDEVRMMVFYLFLVALAMWGFTAREMGTEGRG